MSPHVSLGKKSVMIYLPTDVVDESRRYGLNISRISQNALKDTISKLNGTTKPAIESDGDGVVRPPGCIPNWVQNLIFPTNVGEFFHHSECEQEQRFLSKRGKQVAL